MKRDLTINEWLKAYDNGEFTCDPNRGDKVWTAIINAGWFDWFCSDKHCYSQIKPFASKVKSIAKSTKLDADKMYVIFKNNCPMVGPLYDDMRICDIESGDVVYCIEQRKRGVYGEDFQGWKVYSKEDGFVNPVVEGKWSEVKHYFEAA